MPKITKSIEMPESLIKRIQAEADANLRSFTKQAAWMLAEHMDAIDAQKTK